MADVSKAGPYTVRSRERVRNEMDEQIREAFALLKIDNSDLKGGRSPSGSGSPEDHYFRQYGDGDDASVLKNSGEGMKKWANSQLIIPWLRARVSFSTGSALSEMELHCKFVEDLEFDIDRDAFLHGLQVFAWVEGIRIVWDKSTSEGENDEAKIENVAWKNDSEDDESFLSADISDFELEQFAIDVLAMEPPDFTMDYVDAV